MLKTDADMKQMTKKTYYLLIIVLLLFVGCRREQTRLTLAGKWQVALDSLDQGDSLGWNNRTFPTSIQLPGTTDQAGLGTPCTLQPALTNPQLLHLTRVTVISELPIIRERLRFRLQPQVSMRC